MRIGKREHIIEFETSRSLEEISMKIANMVDFNYRDYRFSNSLTKDFYGDVVGPGRFSFALRPRIFALWDMVARIDPKVDLEVQSNRVKIHIHDPSLIIQYLVNLLVLAFTAGLFMDDLPGITIREVVINTGIFLGALFIINILAADRFRSTIKKVERKIIDEIK